MNSPWAKKITKITYVPDLGSSPANVNRITGELKISLKWWNVLPPCHRAFILAHEMGHLAGKTFDETEADNIGFNIYKDMGYDVTCSIFALSDVLSYKNGGREKRVNAAFNRVLNYHKNNNNKTKQWQLQKILSN